MFLLYYMHNDVFSRLKFSTMFFFVKELKLYIRIRCTLETDDCCDSVHLVHYIITSVKEKAFLQLFIKSGKYSLVSRKSLSNVSSVVNE